MTYLLDVNVLVALAWPVHVHHEPAHQWFADYHRRGWATCAVTEAGFIRVSSNRRATPDARPPAEAAAVLHAMCNLARHFFIDDSVRLSQHTEELRDAVHGSGQVTDVHLLLLAARSDLTLVTFDKGAAELAGHLRVPVDLLTIN